MTMRRVLLRDVNNQLAVEARRILRRHTVAAKVEPNTPTSWNVTVPEEDFQKADEILSTCEL
jgi:type III secretory pathway lipoprotein EscJ